MKLAKSAREN